MVFFHENAGSKFFYIFLIDLILDIGLRLEYFMKYIKNVNTNILVIAYRGYSDSEGTPTEEGLKSDG